MHHHDTCAMSVISEHIYLYPPQERLVWWKTQIIVGAFCTGRNTGISFGVWLALKCEWGPYKWAHWGLAWLHDWGAELLRLLYASQLWHPWRALLLQHSASCPETGSRVTPCSAPQQEPLQSWTAQQSTAKVSSDTAPGVRAPGWVLIWAAGLSLCHAPKSLLCW